MLILAHRGCHERVPENTVAAFQRAQDAGVDGIETDVRLTADSRLVLFHDRTVPDGRDVAVLTNAEMEAAAGYLVPTLDAVLDGFPDLMWNVEIKAPAALEATIETLRKYVGRRRILVTSFWHDIVHAVNRRVAVDCGLLIDHRPVHLSSLRGLVESGATIRTLVWDYEVLDVEILRASAAIGFSHYAYGARTAAEHDRCSELKLAGIITDYPELARRSGRHDQPPSRSLSV